MAKATEGETRRKPNKGKSTLTWLMTGMLVLGLGGFGVTNFGGTLTSIGSVGRIDLTARDYARAVQQEAAGLSQQIGMQIGVQEAIGFGIDRQALAGLVTRAALDNAALEAGLSVGDQTVAAEVMKQAAFTGSSGAFDPAMYREVLSRSGWKEADYENSLRRDVARALLTGAVSGGFVAPAPLTDTLHRWIGERRGFSMIRLGEADLQQPLAAIGEDELKAHYEANIADFTRPEAKRIRYAALLPEDLAADQPVDEALLRALYDERIAEYVIPPRRLVERLVYPDAPARDAALARLAEGATFEDLVADRGLPMDAVDMGDVSEQELGEAGAAVFAAETDAVIAAESALGPALFRVNGTLDGKETGFDEAREELAAELQIEEARHIINERIDEIDDLLAGGASLDDLASQTGMKTGTLDHAPGAQGTDPLEGYQAFRQAADALQPGDFAEAIVLDDGGVVALEFVETVPAAPIPFDEARAAVEAAMQSGRLRAALAEQALRLKAEAEAGAALDTLGRAETTAEIARDGSVDNAPASLTAALFSMEEGEIRVIEEGDFVALVRLDSIAEADEAGDGAAALKAALAAQIEQAIAQDAFAAFADAVSAEAGITLDQNAINLVNSGLQ